MSDPTTTNIVMAVPTRNSDTGTWDTPVNGNANILDACLGAVTSKSLLTANVTLSSTESQVAILRFTGALINNVTITLGAIIKSWVCENLTTGAFTVTVQGSPATGNVVALPPGSCQLYWDGTNVSFLNLGKVGEFWDYVGSTVPAWITACTVPPYLSCAGGTFSAVTYPLLNAILGGTTLPDSRGRFRATLNQTTGRITLVDGNTNLSGGGAESVQIGAANLPALTVKYNQININNPASGTPTTITQNIDSSGSTQSNGAVNAGAANTNTNKLPPAYIGGISMIRAA